MNSKISFKSGVLMVLFFIFNDRLINKNNYIILPDIFILRRNYSLNISSILKDLVIL